LRKGKPRILRAHDTVSRHQLWSQNEEVTQVLGQLHGTPRLMASLLYGAGLRLMECVRLRVKDLDFT
jgi:integrase